MSRAFELPKLVRSTYYPILCQPRLEKLVYVPFSSLELERAPTRNDTHNRKFLRCDLGANLTSFALPLRRKVVVLRKQNVASPARLAKGKVGARHGMVGTTGHSILSCMSHDVVVLVVLWRNVEEESQLTCSNPTWVVLRPIFLVVAYLDIVVRVSGQTECAFVVSWTWVSLLFTHWWPFS